MLFFFRSTDRILLCFFFSSRRRHTRSKRDWSSDVCSSDLIYMNGNPHPRGHIDWYMGDSRGRWEGNTLVVDVVDFNDETWFDRAGNFHSDALHLVERFTPAGPDHLLYEVTIEDPKVFTRPWKMSMPLYRRQEKDAQLMDFKCVEFVEELIYGKLRKTPLNK